jgi:DNA-binding NarL/FixJ family response regulator
MTPKHKREQCQSLRQKGFSLNEIARITRLPKTTVQNQVRDIRLSLKARRRIQDRVLTGRIKGARQKRGHCLEGRIVLKPDK